MGTASTIQAEALNLYHLVRAGKISEEEALERNKALRAASKLIDDELRLERAAINFGRDFHQIL